jgi:hypothetical protein
MNQFSTYYNQQFREDLNKFFSGIPDESRFHEDRENKIIHSIQIERLTGKYPHLDFLDNEEKAFFGVALYFTILVDMVCYTYYRQDYSIFQNLTRYPKFIGNCMGGCRYHFHPSGILKYMSHNRLGEEKPAFSEVFELAIPVMRQEVDDFFKEHLWQINGNLFWEKCQAEFPFRRSSPAFI